MAKATAGFTPVRAGADPRKETTMGGTTSQMWLTLASGEAMNIISLVDASDILACDQCAIWLDEGNSPVWVYTGPDDPSHDLNIERRYRAYLPCLVNKEPKVFSMGKSVHMALLDIADAVGSIEGVELRIKRTGNGLATRYSVAQTGKRYDVSKQPEIDVISLLGPITPEGVRDLLVTKLGKSDYEEVVASYRGKSKPGKGKPYAPAMSKVSKTKVEAEEEELEDVELL